MLADDVSAALPGLRAEAEARMLDVFQIWEPSDRVTDERGIEGPGYVPVGQTIGRLAGTSAQSDTGARTERIGGADRVVLAGGLHVPISAPMPKLGHYGIGWEFELITPGSLTDPGLVGSRWLAVGMTAKSFVTARRLDVVELSMPQV